MGALIPYLGLYFQALGFSALQIGLLMGGLIGTKVIAPNLWGWLADASHKLVIWIQLSSFFSLLILAGLGILDSFWALLGIILLFGFFWHATLPLFEAYTFKTLENHMKAAYGRVRLWGSIGFIVAVLWAGSMIAHWGIESLPLMLIGVLGLGFVSTLWIREKSVHPSLEAHQAFHEEIAVLSVWQILHQPWVIGLLLVSFLIQFSHGAYYSFYSIYLTEAGYSQSLIAWLWALGVIAEIGIFYYMTVLLHHWSAWQLLKVALFLTVMRWLMIAEAVESLTILLFAQLLHAASYGLFHAGAIYLIDQHFAHRTQARGQAIYASISHGLGGGLGMLMAGIWWHDYGGEVTYLINAAVVAFALLMLYLVPNNIGKGLKRG